VKAATADLDEFVPVYYRGKSQTAIVGGTNEDFSAIFNWTVAEGRFFTRGELETGRKVVVIGAKIKAELFPLSSPLGEELRLGQERYRVVGVLSRKGGFGQFDWDNTVYMPLSAAERFFGRATLDFLYFKIEEGLTVEEMARRVSAVLARRYETDKFSVLQQSDLFQAADSIIGAITVALGGIAAISLLVGGIGIMNIMLVTVAERTKEIGLRKAVGARPRDILAQFLTEAVVLSGLGGALGILLGVGGSLLLGRFLATEVTSWSVVLSFSVSATVGIVFGFVPAYKAAKLDPIAALRYE
jgi:putative ABC transport system permease protein